MSKDIIKEIIIILVLCLVIILALTFLMYNLIPSNKVLPAEANYQASSEIKKQINEVVESDQTEVVLKYEVTSTDLKNYQRTKDYKAGKVNPFGTVDSGDVGSGNTGTSTKSSTGTNTGTSSTSTKDDTTTSSSATKSNTTTGTYFETKSGTK